jgi:hypothetical protein
MDERANNSMRWRWESAHRRARTFMANKHPIPSHIQRELNITRNYFVDQASNDSYDKYSTGRRQARANRIDQYLAKRGVISNVPVSPKVVQNFITSSDDNAPPPKQPQYIADSDSDEDIVLPKHQYIADSDSDEDYVIPPPSPPKQNPPPLIPPPIIIQKPPPPIHKPPPPPPPPPQTVMFKGKPTKVFTGGYTPYNPNIPPPPLSFAPAPTKPVDQFMEDYWYAMSNVPFKPLHKKK